MKYLLEKFLQSLAYLLVRKYKPTIIAITGSVGKTSAKEAIHAVLKDYFDVWKSPANYNNELGVPLTIIGCESAGHSIKKWLGAFWRGFSLLFGKHHYPKILVLEMGADHPGDIKNLVKLAPPTIAVVTAVSPVHLEFFSNLKKVAAEKSKILEKLTTDGTAILNADDELVLEMKQKTKSKVLTFGFNSGASVYALELIESLGNGLEKGEALGKVNFKIAYEGSIVPMSLINVLGRQHVYAALAATAVGLTLGLNLIEISKGLEKYEAPRGRMKLIPGIKNTLLIDDTYNSSPRAALEALDVLGRLPAAENTRRFAVLGDMLELGAFTEEAHKQVGERAAKCADRLILVGEAMSFAKKAAVKSGLAEEHILHFHNAPEAGHFLQDEVKEGDVLLIKGSQGMRMEKVVKELMAEPLKAGELLVRQSKEWLD
ncbi:MAG: Mur ligase family protein [bacterium]|nr:Mur ligase family protein [bacterium]